jgi:NDP-sugar pyrophosphorylase family protein
MSASSELVGLVPAAGYATRLQPLEGSKETVAVQGRPLMSFLLERMRFAGCSRIRVTTRPEKADVIALAELEGLEIVLGNPASVSESLLAALEGLDGDAIALAGFPDTIWRPLDGFTQILNPVREGEDLVLGLFRVSEPERCDIVELSALGRIERITVKPPRPATDLTWGLLAARVSLLRNLAGWSEPGHFFDSIAQTRPLRGVLLAGPYEDAGTRESLTRLARAGAYDQSGEARSGAETTTA